MSPASIPGSPQLLADLTFRWSLFTEPVRVKVPELLYVYVVEPVITAWQASPLAPDQLVLISVILPFVIPAAYVPALTSALFSLTVSLVPRDEVHRSAVAPNVPVRPAILNEAVPDWM